MDHSASAEDLVKLTERTKVRFFASDRVSSTLLVAAVGNGS